MGAYLSEPLKDKTSEDGEGNNVMFGASCMQGWRVSQEDAHNCVVNFDEKASLFAVYDGHGGAEVAVFLARHFPEFLKNLESYKQGELKEALHQGFVKIDEFVKSEGLAEVQAIAQEAKTKKGKPPTAGNSSGDCEDEDVNELYEEATMPLEMLVARYKKGLLNHLSMMQAAAEDNVDKPGSSKAILSSPPKSKTSTSESDAQAQEQVATEEIVGSSKNQANAAATETATATKLEVEATETKADTESVPALNESLKEEEPKVNGNAAEHPLETAALKAEGGTAPEEVTKSETEAEVKVNGCEKPEEITVQQNGVSKSPIKPSQEDADSSSISLNGDERREESILVEQTPVKVRKGKSHPPPPAPIPVSAPSGRKLKDKKIYSDFVNAGDSTSDSEEEVDESYIAVEGSDSDASELEETMDNSDDTSDADEGEEDGDEGEEGAEEEAGLEDVENDSDDEEDMLADAQEPGFDSGCTAVVAFLKWQPDSELMDLWVANAGDSRCTVSRGGVAFDMSHDHKPEDEPEAARIVAAGGKVTADGRVNGGLNLSRAIGDHSYKQNQALPLEEQMITPVPDIQHLVLNPSTDDFIVLACDGVWNSMTSQEVVDFVDTKLKANPPLSLSSICEQLFEVCLSPDTSGDGTGCDNMTAVIIKLGFPPESINDNGKRSRLSSTSPPPDDCKRVRVEVTD